MAISLTLLFFYINLLMFFISGDELDGGGEEMTASCLDPEPELENSQARSPQQLRSPEEVKTPAEVTSLCSDADRESLCSRISSEPESVCSRVSSEAELNKETELNNKPESDFVVCSRVSSEPEVESVCSKASSESQLTSGSLWLGQTHTELTSSDTVREDGGNNSLDSDNVSEYSDHIEFCTGHEEADQSASDTDYYSIKSDDIKPEGEPFIACISDAEISSVTSDDDDYGREDSVTVINTVPVSPLKVLEQDVPTEIMLGKKKKTLSVSTEHLPAPTAPAVSSVPGEQAANRQLSRLSMSHPEMYRVEMEPELAAPPARKTGGGLKRSLKKLRQVFRGAPKLSEAAVYKAVDFQDCVNQNPIYIAR
jgi:hypothetical protein